MLMPAYAKEQLHLNKVGLGYCYTSIGVGAITGLVLVTALNEKQIRALFIRLAMTTLGVAMFGIALTRSAPIAFILFGVTGMCTVMQFNITNTLFQLLSPDKLRGRVLSMHIWALSGLGPFGTLLFGWIAQVASIPRALSIGGGCVLAFAAWSWIARGNLAGIP